MNESIDTFKVIYICRKTNLCLVLQEDFTKSNYFVNDTNFIETFQRIVKETEYLKIRVVDNKLQILFQSLKRNCTKLDLENTHLFKLLYVKDRYLFHVNHNLENNQNLEFGKNHKTNECGFFVKNELSYYIKNKINDILDRHTNFLNYNEIKKIFFTNNEVYGFEPIVIYANKNRINKNNMRFIPIRENIKIS